MQFRVSEDQFDNVKLTKLSNWEQDQQQFSKRVNFVLTGYTFQLLRTPLSLHQMLTASFESNLPEKMKIQCLMCILGTDLQLFTCMQKKLRKRTTYWWYTFDFNIQSYAETVLFQSNHSMYLTMSNLSINLVIHRSGFFLTFQRPDKKRKGVSRFEQRRMSFKVSYLLHKPPLCSMSDMRKKKKEPEVNFTVSYPINLTFSFI